MKLFVGAAFEITRGSDLGGLFNIRLTCAAILNELGSNKDDADQHYPLMDVNHVFRRQNADGQWVLCTNAKLRLFCPEFEKFVRDLNARIAKSRDTTGEPIEVHCNSEVVAAVLKLRVAQPDVKIFHRTVVIDPELSEGCHSNRGTCGAQVAAAVRQMTRVDAKDAIELRCYPEPTLIGSVVRIPMRGWDFPLVWDGPLVPISFGGHYYCQQRPMSPWMKAEMMMQLDQQFG